MPDGAAFSQGRPYGTTEWNLRPDEIGELRLRLPKTANGGSDMRVELDGGRRRDPRQRRRPGSTSRADPRAALILRAEESGRVAGLIAHGQKMIEVGYFAGAARLFQARGARRAAAKPRCCSAPPTIRTSSTRSARHGIKADPKEAQRLVRARQAARGRGRRGQAQGAQGRLDPSARSQPGDRCGD